MPYNTDRETSKIPPPIPSLFACGPGLVRPRKRNEIRNAFRREGDSSFGGHASGRDRKTRRDRHRTKDCISCHREAIKPRSGKVEHRWTD